MNSAKLKLKMEVKRPKFVARCGHTLIHTVIKRVRVDLGTSYKAASWSHPKIPMLVDTKFIFSW